MPFRCFACDRLIRTTNPAEADTRDGQTVFVGSDCMNLINAAGNEGYKPPKGGPRLFPMNTYSQPAQAESRG